MSPTLAEQFSTTTECPRIDSPTQPNSVVAITLTSSVIDVGIMFHGVTVNTKITAVAIEIITRNFNAGGFCCLSVVLTYYMLRNILFKLVVKIDYSAKNLNHAKIFCNCSTVFSK